MTGTSILAGLGAASASGLVLATAEQLSTGERWTVLALLAVVVVGIGHRLVAAVDRNTTASQATTAALASVAAKLDALSDKIEQLPVAVADEIERRRRRG